MKKFITTGILILTVLLQGCVMLPQGGHHGGMKPIKVMVPVIHAPRGGR